MVQAQNHPIPAFLTAILNGIVGAPLQRQDRGLVQRNSNFVAVGSVYGYQTNSRSNALVFELPVGMRKRGKRPPIKAFQKDPDRDVKVEPDGEQGPAGPQQMRNQSTCQAQSTCQVG